MLMSYDDFSYLLNTSSEEVKNRVIDILTSSQWQPESPEELADKDHTDA